MRKSHFPRVTPGVLEAQGGAYQIQCHRNNQKTEESGFMNSFAAI